MKFLVIQKPIAGAPWPQDRLALWESAKQWTNNLLADGTLDCAYNLPAGGGLGIVNASSHEQLTEILAANPGSVVVDYEIQPLSDVNHLFDLAIAAIKRRQQ